MRRQALLLLVLLLVPLGMAANDPGHDTLYIEETGDSELTGNLNISDEFRVENLWYSSNLHIVGNGTILGAPTRPRIMGGTTQMYIDSTGNLYINTLGGPSAIVQMGDVITNAITLNVSGTILQQNVQVCLSNGSFCSATSSGANVTGSGTTGTFAKWVGATEIGNSIVSESGSLLMVTGTLETSNNINTTGYVNASMDVCIVGGNCLSSVGGGSSSWVAGSGTIYNTTANVSIGGLNPVYRLFVNSSDGEMARFVSSGAGAVVGVYRDDISAGGSSDYAGIQLGTLNDGTLWDIATDTEYDGGFDLSIFSQGTSANVMTFVYASGYVGVNESTPGEVLEVRGNINSSGGDVCITGGNCLSSVGGSGFGSGWRNDSGSGNISMVVPSANISLGSWFVDNANDALSTAGATVENSSTFKAALVLEGIRSSGDYGILVNNTAGANPRASIGFAVDGDAWFVGADGGSTPGNVFKITENVAGDGSGVANGNSRLQISPGGEILLYMGGGSGDDDPSLQLELWNSDGVGQGILLVRDTVVVSGETLGGIGFDSDDGEEPVLLNESSASIIAFAAEDHGAGDKGGDLTFWTSPIDQDDNTAGFERMRVTSEGLVGVGTASPTAKFEVSGSTNLTDGNVSIEETFSLCFNSACTSRIYYNTTHLVIEGS